MKGFLYGLLAAAVMVPLLANAQQPVQSQPCVRTGPHAPGTPDLDATRCQMALDAQKLGELQSALSASTASLALTQQDLAKANADKATAERKTKDWELYAKPLYAPQNTSPDAGKPSGLHIVPAKP